ncbi:polysaccharide biosynthesis/export family protein [Methylobacter sp. S3L5C]|uniref:polysaccharide biosynthesis/export family protein n=1 Tax=Methylobacter sp. S3L5C TaxID=2839024 RepID=UPI001FAE0708|nr:polysaccharide biosynthesis/export family protein [Methylobacter sp. S3L5C]UOA09133.1 polysaccharide export protein [Methylobacter sp. S3L5C]
MNKIISLRSIVMLCLLLLSACGAWESIPDATPGADKAFNVPDRSKRISETSAIEAFKVETKHVEDYLLYDGDDINIEVIGRPELSGMQRIGPDGRISLSVVGSVMVRSLTREKAAEIINKALSPYYLNIYTTVRVEHYNSNRITIIGRVEHPGELLFNTPPNLLTILAQAGGMPLLRKEQVLTRCAIIRGDKILWIDLTRLLTGDTNLNVSLQRNDVIYIPDSTDTSVFVLGAVNHPGVFSLTPQMSFMDALGQAGGPTKDADFNELHLIRPGSNVNMKIDMSDILAPQKNLNVAINEGDIIYVPHSGISKIGYIVQQINPFATLLMFGAIGMGL